MARSAPEPSQAELVAAIDACACFQIRRASRAVTQLYDAALKPTGLRSTQFVILAIVRIEEPVTQPVLADALGLERTTLTRNLSPLVTACLVSRSRVKGQRATVIALTPKGRRTLARAVPLWAKVQKSFSGALGAARWDALRRRLKDVTAAASEA